MKSNSFVSDISNSQGIEEYLRHLLHETYQEDETAKAVVDLTKLPHQELQNYLQVMRKAIIPKADLISELFFQSFIFSSPKEHISGDFYWVEQSDERIFIATVDCKEAGITGAMMSLVCTSTLNRVLNEFKIKDTGKMLDKMRELLVELLRNSESGRPFEVNISLCCINKITCVLEWSGAGNNLFYVHNGIMEELAPNSNPIGESDSAISFTKHKMYLSKGDMIYLFTNGIINQVGGQNEDRLGKKCFREILLRISPLMAAAQKDILQNKFESWKYNLDQTDDVLVIGLRL